jgi:AAA15 family ATPase/GTPase
MKDLQKIAQMVGSTYMYKKENYTLKGFIPEEQKVRILTDKQDIVLLNDGLHHSLSLFLEVEQEPQLPQVVKKSEVQTAMGSLTSILLENIETVRKDKDFIPQAESINTSIKTMIDMAKAEIDYRKTELDMMKLQLGK